MDQSNRYADLSLKEEDLIAGQNHILVAYTMEPAAGYGYLEVAAQIAEDTATGT
ncbi:MAG: ribulose 1,5-bisphosphate carboxylase, partial [Hydrogenovibrio crunogenus]|nr:ribulose 1,5-bisphosphate carboxylase [Hydrogenovibrio crunogenus]